MMHEQPISRLNQVSWLKILTVKFLDKKIKSLVINVIMKLRKCAYNV